MNAGQPDSELFRTFRDSRGVEWKVWVVVPTARERDILQSEINERRLSDVRSAMGVDRDARNKERRERWERGWLLFESQDENRRLSPIPDDWSSATESALRQMCEEAQPTPRAVR